MGRPTTGSLLGIEQGREDRLGVAPGKPLRTPAPALDERRKAAGRYQSSVRVQTEFRLNEPAMRRALRFASVTVNKTTRAWFEKGKEHS
jgi:hypothetical protein